jgi:hypothetical protein
MDGRYEAIDNQTGKERVELSTNYYIKNRNNINDRLFISFLNVEID